MRFANTIEIRRPLHEVFAYLSDFGNLPSWNNAITSAEQSPGPTAVGTRIQQRRALPIPSEETLEVIEFEPDRRLVLRGALGPFEGVTRYELEPSEAGTILTNSAELDAGRSVALAPPIAAGRVRQVVAENLGVLKRLLETNRQD